MKLAAVQLIVFFHDFETFDFKRFLEIFRVLRVFFVVFNSHRQPLNGYYLGALFF